LTEEEAWKKRQEEAKKAGTAGASDKWEWTLNWDEVVEGQILVGSCPRSADDARRLMEEAGVDAIVSLQSDACIEALEIPLEEVKATFLEGGAVYARVAVRDFDHNDQAAMLPEAVRILGGLVARGHTVYCHCTAGINRATLTVVGYLTFLKGYRLDDAVDHVRSRRPVAHPYIDCWHVVRKRMLHGREEELTGISGVIYKERCETGAHGNMDSDWRAAERRLITQTFERRILADNFIVDAERAIAATRSAASTAAAATAEDEEEKEEEEQEAMYSAAEVAAISAADAEVTAIAAQAAAAAAAADAGEEDDEAELMAVPAADASNDLSEAAALELLELREEVEAVLAAKEAAEKEAGALRAELGMYKEGGGEMASASSADDRQEPEGAERAMVASLQAEVEALKSELELARARDGSARSLKAARAVAAVNAHYAPADPADPLASFLTDYPELADPLNGANGTAANGAAAHE